MILSKENLNALPASNLTLPAAQIFELPEKVLQFGTGVLLRGLPDYFIDKANRQGVFNGRVAVVKSTPGATSEFDQQDSLYTLCIRGLEYGQPVEENIVSAAISRVISATEDWPSVLEIARSSALKLIISNTTEVGIQLLSESIAQNPPVSFPAKVLAVLYERFKAFEGAKNTGLVIIATELIPDNGTKLKQIVLELANYNTLGDDFISWLHNENTFCNSLVDRIVPGKPDAAALEKINAILGYTDHLLAMAEPYRLWAIEGDEKVAAAVAFAQVDSGLIIANDIEIYRELKVRLLNGTHTLSSGIAFLAGIDTVKHAMDNEWLKSYIEGLMAAEIGPAIPYQISEAQTTAFANSVKDRFANPAIKHLWINITFQYSMKMKIRILPLLLNYYQLFNKVPEYMALGFAAYLRFMRVDKQENQQFYGTLNGESYLITDDSAAYFAIQAQQGDNYAKAVLGDTHFWGTALQELPGFVEAVSQQYELLVQEGIAVPLAELTALKLNSF